MAQVEPTEMASTGRRVYLVVVFGLSAIVALIALLVVGYRIFEFLLDPATGVTVVDRVRAPLGLLVATALVSGYHFTVWRHDRSATAGMAPATRTRAISQVILVTGAAPEPQAQAVEDATGASVTVWRRAAVAGEVTAAGPDAEQLARALDGVTGRRVLVVTGPGSQVQVVPLAD